MGCSNSLKRGGSAEEEHATVKCVFSTIDDFLHLSPSFSPNPAAKCVSLCLVDEKRHLFEDVCEVEEFERSYFGWLSSKGDVARDTLRRIDLADSVRGVDKWQYNKKKIKLDALPDIEQVESVGEGNKRVNNINAVFALDLEGVQGPEVKAGLDKKKAEVHSAKTVMSYNLRNMYEVSWLNHGDTLDKWRADPALLQKIQQKVSRKLTELVHRDPDSSYETALVTGLVIAKEGETYRYRQSHSAADKALQVEATLSVPRLVKLNFMNNNEANNDVKYGLADIKRYENGTFLCPFVKIVPAPDLCTGTIPASGEPQQIQNIGYSGDDGIIISGVHNINIAGLEAEHTIVAPWRYTMRRDTAIKRVQEDWRELESLDNEYKNDRTVVLAALKQSEKALELASETLRNSPEFILEALEVNGYVLRYVSRQLRCETAYVAEAVRNTSYAFTFADDKLKMDRDAVAAIVDIRGEALQYVDESLRSDEKIALIAVRQNGYALEFVPESLPGYKEIVLAAVRQDGLALQFAPQELAADKEVVLIATEQNGLAFAYAAFKLKSDRLFALTVVERCGLALQYVSDALQSDEEVMLF